MFKYANNLHFPAIKKANLLIENITFHESRRVVCSWYIIMKKQLHLVEVLKFIDNCCIKGLKVKSSASLISFGFCEAR